jgi:NADPH:quinone reductase-like Zn-dependent oxidoreductase
MRSLHCAASPGRDATWSSVSRLNLTLLKSCDVCGVFWGAFAARDPKANAAHVAELFRLWDEGRINPRVSATYSLERGGEAIAAMAARKVIGKLVVTID